MSALYNREILRLAVSIPHQERLSDPHGSAELRSPTCGSVIATDVRVDAKGRVEQYGIAVNACALGQASAAILSGAVIGLTEEEIASRRTALAALLEGETTTDLLPGSDVLEPARDHRGRHAAILLPYDATLAALNDAGKARTH